MKVNQVIKTCCDICDIPYDSTIFDEQTAPTDSTSEVGKMLIAYHLCMDGIYSKYASPVTFTATAVDREIELPEACKAVKVVDQHGNEVAFMQLDYDLRVMEDGVYTVTYVPVAPDIYWQGLVMLPKPNMPPTVVVVGTVATYYAIQADNARYQSWSQVFEQTTQPFEQKIEQSQLSHGGNMPTSSWL